MGPRVAKPRIKLLFGALYDSGERAGRLGQACLADQAWLVVSGPHVSGQIRACRTNRLEEVG